MLTEPQHFLLPWNTVKREQAACCLLTVGTGGGGLVQARGDSLGLKSRGRGWAAVGVGVKGCVSLEEGFSL